MKGLVGAVITISYVLFFAFALWASTNKFAQSTADGKFFVSVDNGQLHVSDFFLIYVDGCMARSSDAHRVYDPDVQLKWQTLISKGHLDKPFYSELMPFVFTLMAPLSLLPMHMAYFTWLAICLPLGFGGFFFFVRNYSTLSLTQIYWVLTGAALSLPTIMNISIGQQGIILLGLISMFFSFLLSKKDIPAGLLLALTSFKPHYCLFFAMPALAKRRWKLIAWAAAFELILLSLAAFTIGWHNVVAYPATVVQVETAGIYPGVNGKTMISVMGPLSCLAGQSVALSLSMLITILGATATYFIWSQYRTFGSTKQRLAMSMTVLLCLLASPHSHAYDLPMLAILAATLPTTELTKILGFRPFSRMLWCLIIYLYPVLSWGFGLLVLYQEAVPTLLFFITNAILLACAFRLFNEPVNESADHDVHFS